MTLQQMIKKVKMRHLQQMIKKMQLKQQVIKKMEPNLQLRIKKKRMHLNQEHN
jgi:hypothetical protein